MSAEPAPVPDGVPADRAGGLLLELLRRTHLSAPSDLTAVVADQAQAIGAAEAVTYLIDLEQEVLRPVPIGAPASTAEPQSVAGSIAGRAFTSTRILRGSGQQPGSVDLWLPLLDGTERVGVLRLRFAAEAVLTEEVVEISERYAHLVALLVISKGAYSDVFELVRRRRPMTIASELSWALAPPMVFATDGLSVAGMLEPCYDNGGDALDYALNDGVLHFGVFDAMGHGLPAAGVAAFAISAYRHSRRVGSDLQQTYATMRDAVGEQYPDDRFVTALIGQIAVATGRLQVVSAGHPPPLLVRGGRHSRTIEVEPALPLGMEMPAREAPMTETQLEPGDLVLAYTDGLTEARLSDGQLVSVGGLAGFVEREAAARRTVPETLRRLRRAVVDDARAELRDDATALLVQWRGDDPAELVPETVLVPDA